MPVPSFDELLSQAREIGRIKKEAGDFPRGELIAKSVSDFVNKLLFTQGQDRATYSSQLDPSTGKVTSLSTPQVSGRSLFEKMLGIRGYEGQPSGMIPLTSKDTSTFGMTAGLQNLKRETQDTPVAVGYNEETGTAGEVYRGKPGEKLSVFGYGKKNKDGSGNIAGTIPPDKAGLYTLAQESIKNISRADKVLFPGTNTESFNRGAAAKSNVFGGAAPFSEEGQNVRRWLTSSLAARQLIQTGVAARPEEAQSLLDNFMAGVTSDPKAAKVALQELSRFYSAYTDVLVNRKPIELPDTPSLDALISKKADGKAIPVSSEEEALALPAGTKFILNGKTGTVQ